MSDLLQIKKTELCLGLKKQYKFLQISDMHMSCIYEDSSELDVGEHKHFLEQWIPMKYTFAKDFGEFCDERYDVEPTVMFKLLTDYACQIGADALIFSGDIIDRVTDSNIRFMKEFLANYPLPVIYCPGNHCWINEIGEKFCQYDRLKGVIENPECDSFDFGEFSVVTVDNGMKKITQKQIDFLKEQLNGEKPILLVLHAPLNLGEFGDMLAKKLSPYFLMGSDGDCENAFEFNKIVANNSEKIIAVLAGHIHGAQDGEIVNGLKLYTTSSGLIGACREIIIK